MSRSISYRKGTSSGFSTAINVRCRNEKINVISVNTLGWIDIHNSMRFLYVSTYIYISKDMEFFPFQVRKYYLIQNCWVILQWMYFVKRQPGPKTIDEDKFRFDIF